MLLATARGVTTGCLTYVFCGAFCWGYSVRLSVLAACATITRSAPGSGLL